MEYTLAKVQRRLPVLKETRARHKRTVMSIESYSKSMDYASRMADLEHKVLAARKRQAAWDYVQRWVLPAGMEKELRVIQCAACIPGKGKY